MELFQVYMRSFFINTPVCILLLTFVYVFVANGKLVAYKKWDYREMLIQTKYKMLNTGAVLFELFKHLLQQLKTN